LLAGRELQRHYKQEPQDIITNPLIEGLDGRKMSSSWGNTINLFDSANEMYGKVMSLQDELIVKYFVLTTRVDLAEINKLDNEMRAGKNPRDLKMRLAFEIVKFYHSADQAAEAEKYFVNTFSKKEIPDNVPSLKPSQYDIVTILLESKISPTKSEARRVIEQGGVKVNGTVNNDFKKIVEVGDVIQKGKRFFVKIA
jgi:tyrosyl-tRNA synthetase